MRLALLRVLQEALNNTVRHAKASRVSCALRRDGNQIVIDFEDDGAGLPAQEARGRGRGLGNMARRVQDLGGTFTLDAARPRGLRLSASIPTLARLA